MGHLHSSIITMCFKLVSTFENSARKWKWINRERIKAIIIIMFEIVSDVVRAFPP